MHEKDDKCQNIIARHILERKRDINYKKTDGKK